MYVYMRLFVPAKCVFGDPYKKQTALNTSAINQQDALKQMFDHMS